MSRIVLGTFGHTLAVNRTECSQFLSYLLYICFWLPENYLSLILGSSRCQSS
jgi:hypothetical protein